MTATDRCFHCELPLGRRVAHASIGGEPQRFCCYGCVLAQQVTQASGEPGAAAAILIRLGLAVFCAMNVMAFSLPTYAPYIYADAGLSAEAPLFQILRLLSAAFALPVIVLLGGPVVAAAARGLRQGMLTADTLIVLGAAAAYGLSLAHVAAGKGEVYFETASMLLVIVTIGRYLEARAKADAGTLVKAALSPAVASAVRLTAARAELIAPEQLALGDVVRVAPGDAFPTDGLVLRGSGSADEAALTGESRPVPKQAGTSVAGGTCSIDGTFEVLVTSRQSESATARIAELLSAALSQRGHLERLADRAAQLMIPGIVVLALLTGIGWAIIGDTGQALMNSMAVLVVACPCALGIATPAAMWMGLLAAARRGVVVRNGAAVERAAGVERVLFDKTGTLTSRSPEVERVDLAPQCTWSVPEALAAAGLLEENITHPMARALVAAGRQASPAVGVVEDLQVVPGRGVRGRVNGAMLTVGSVSFALDDLPERASSWVSGLPPSAVVLWNASGALAAFSFRESVQPSAAAAVARLRQLGIAVGILSGDQSLGAVVPALFATGEARSGLSAADKVDAVREQRRSASIAMVGDGLNDAPAAAAADLGIAVAAATDLTRVSADVVILDDDLTLVPWFLHHARRIRRVMRQNLFWAGGYNFVAVTMAVLGRLNPLIAAVIMVASSVLVIANARRLLRPVGGSVAGIPANSHDCESVAGNFTNPSKESPPIRSPSTQTARHVP